MNIVNKVLRPLVVPLPLGKKLRLSVGKTAHVNDRAKDYPPLVKMIEAGEIEVVAGSHGSSVGPGSQVSTGSAGKARRTTINKGGNRSS